MRKKVFRRPYYSPPGVEKPIRERAAGQKKASSYFGLGQIPGEPSRPESSRRPQEEGEEPSSACFFNS